MATVVHADISMRRCLQRTVVTKVEMDRELLESRFARMGARLKVQERAPAAARRHRQPGAWTCSDDRQASSSRSACVPPWTCASKSWTCSRPSGTCCCWPRRGTEKPKFLCGHDERQWFVAAVPETARLGTVGRHGGTKPAEVQQAQARQKIKTEDRKRRKNAAYVRQGEWFFLPAPDFAVESGSFFERAASRGNGSKPHMGRVLLPHGRRDGLRLLPASRRSDEAAYKVLATPARRPKSWAWQVMQRATRRSTSRAGSATPTTRRSSCTAGTGS